MIHIPETFVNLLNPLENLQVLKNSEFHLPIHLSLINNNYKAPVHSNAAFANELFTKYVSILELFVQNKLNAC